MTGRFSVYVLFFVHYNCALCFICNSYFRTLFVFSPVFFLESETGCLPDTGRTGCMEKLFAGIHTRVCVCTTNFCNGGVGIRVKRDEGEDQKNI